MVPSRQLELWRLYLSMQQSMWLWLCLEHVQLRLMAQHCNLRARSSLVPCGSEAPVHLEYPCFVLRPNPALLKLAEYQAGRMPGLYTHRQAAH